MSNKICGTPYNPEVARDRIPRVRMWGVARKPISESAVSGQGIVFRNFSPPPWKSQAYKKTWFPFLFHFQQLTADGLSHCYRCMFLGRISRSIAILTFREVEPSPIVSVTQEQANKKTMLS